MRWHIRLRIWQSRLGLITHARGLAQQLILLAEQLGGLRLLLAIGGVADVIRHRRQGDINRGHGTGGNRAG